MSLLLSLFCYAFFTGIALSMGFPELRGHWVAMLFAAAFCGCVAGVAALPRRRKPDAVVVLDRPASAPVLRVALVVTGLLLGFARHASTFRGDGVVVATTAGGVVPRTADGSATNDVPLARHVLRRDASAPAGTEAVFRIAGTVQTLRPSSGASATPALDAQGRWRMTLVERRDECEVTLPADAAEVPVPLPFSTIDSFTAVTPDAPAASVVRLPNRIESFTSPRAANSRDAVIATILGRVRDDPDVYNAMSEDGSVRPRTVLDVEPVFVQPAPGEPFYPIESGRIQVSLQGVSDTDRPSEALARYADAFSRLSRTDALGNDVVLRGSLELPQGALNPGTFDNRKFLLSHGIGAQMFLSTWQRTRGPAIEIVKPEGAEAPRSGNPFVMFSLHLRDRMLRVVKETLPFPQSAFAAGITLGMRRGMQSAECVLSDSAANNVQRGTDALHRLPLCGDICQDFVADEFKRSGVNHVLAVSGLHVTIITALLVGIFTLFGANKRYFVPFVLVALVVFSVITGARPSTLRAVIMNSLFLILWAYLRESLRTTVLLSAAIAGFVIMLQNPRLLTDPSFTLSFGAILSLGLLTGPCSRVLAHFRGNDLLALGVSLLLAHVVLAQGWFRVAAPRAALALAALVAAVFALGRLLARRGFRPIGDYGFADLPTAIGGFLAAQGAIQFGMMIPLSAYYFARWPVIGSVANLIAIPLIGLVLQLSMLACLVGLIPYVGPVLAMVLNAANWVFCTLFMLISHWASTYFPYPFVRKLSGVAVGVYYLLVAVFILWPRLSRVLFPKGFRAPRIRRVGLGILAAATLALVAAVFPRSPRADGNAHASVFATSVGSAVLYRAPDGRSILFDTGYTQPSRTRASQAERTVLPRLSELSIRSLDAVVVLSPRPERLDGAALVLEQCLVRRLVLPPSLAACFDPETNALDEEKLEEVLPQDSGDPAIEEARAAILGGFPHPVGDDDETIIPHSATCPGLAAVLKARRPSPVNRLLGIAVRIESAADAKLPGAVLLNAPGRPDAFAALLAARDGGESPAILLAGDTAPACITGWIQDHPVQAVVISDWEFDAPLAGLALHVLPRRNGYAILQHGQIPASLRPSLRQAATNFNRTLAACEDALPDGHVLATDHDGAIDLLLPPAP